MKIIDASNALINTIKIVSDTDCHTQACIIPLIEKEGKPSSAAAALVQCKSLFKVANTLSKRFLLSLFIKFSCQSLIIKCNGKCTYCICTVF